MKGECGDLQGTGGQPGPPGGWLEQEWENLFCKESMLRNPKEWKLGAI
jgi:hypothetical protein